MKNTDRLLNTWHERRRHKNTKSGQNNYAKKWPNTFPLGCTCSHSTKVHSLLQDCPIHTKGNGPNGVSAFSRCAISSRCCGKKNAGGGCIQVHTLFPGEQYLRTDQWKARRTRRCSDHWREGEFYPRKDAICEERGNLIKDGDPGRNEDSVIRSQTSD